VLKHLPSGPVFCEHRPASLEGQLGCLAWVLAPAQRVAGHGGLLDGHVHLGDGVPAAERPWRMD